MAPASTRSRTAAPTGAAVAHWFRAELLIPVLALGVLGFLGSPHLTRAGDDRMDDLARIVPHLQDSINLYRERANGDARYDPIADGWKPLVDAGYLSAEPVNPITGSARISRQLSASAGWRYDPITGQLGACAVDPESGTIRLVPGRR